MLRGNRIKRFQRIFGSRCFSAGYKYEDPSLKLADPEISSLMVAEKARQQRTITLIASENYTSTAVNKAVGSCLTNKYSEGYPGDRFYPGCDNVDKIENICKNRALELFKLDPTEWHANVQAMSGSIANLSAYNAILSPGDRLLALSGKFGGHFSHGFKTPDGQEAISHRLYDTDHYSVKEDGEIDYDEFATKAKEFKPKLIVCGYSVNSLDIDYKYFRKVADSVGAHIHLDMAHISGLIAAGIMKRPFDYVDIATTTTHKTLKGPRGGLIFCKKHLAQKIDGSVFPGIIGGPMNHTIAGLAIALKEANTDNFKRYQEQVFKNSQALAKGLMGLNYKVWGSGTKNHMVLWDTTDMEIEATFINKALEISSINANAVRILSSPQPNAIRVGALACTTRGYTESNMNDIAVYLHQVTERAIQIKNDTHGKLGDFMVAAKNDPELLKLRYDIESYAEKFPIPGI